jgi:hypothetical protein
VTLISPVAGDDKLLKSGEGCHYHEGPQKASCVKAHPISHESFLSASKIPRIVSPMIEIAN